MTGQTIQYEGSGYVYTFNGMLEVQICKTCGIPWAMPEEMLDWARSHPDIWFYCPNGHRWHYPTKTDTQLLREVREALAAEQARHDQTRASLTAQRAQTTRARNERDRIKTRVANGVCPCCNRSFRQLARHMQAKHPEYLAAKDG